MVDMDVLVLGRGARAKGPKDLVNYHQRQLDRLGTPDYSDLAMCLQCGACYTELHCSVLREHEPSGQAHCQFLSIPGAKHPQRCNHPLESSLVRRPHGRDEIVFRPLSTVKLLDLGLWLYRFCSFHKSDSPLFQHITGRPAREPMEDIFDGQRFAPFQHQWCTDPDAVYMFFELAFDFASPFGKAARSSQKTKEKKVGLMHFILLNLPPDQRTQTQNVCTAVVMDKEPSRTINGVLAFVVATLHRLFVDGITVRTADSQSKFLRVVLYVCTGDAPARAKCYGVPHHSGEWPCTCQASGSLIPIPPGARARPPRWSFTSMETFPTRTQQQILGSLATVAAATSKTARNTATSKEARGFRWTPLLSLPYYDAVESVAWDFMHTWGERVVKTIVARFVDLFGEQFVARCNDLSNAARVESGLPADVRNNIPLNIMSYFSTIKAHEVLVFTNTIGEHVFCLSGLLTAELNTVWRMLCDVSRFFSAYRVRSAELQQYNALLRTALYRMHVADPGFDYPPSIHYATHIVENIRLYGPSYTTW